MKKVLVVMSLLIGSVAFAESEQPWEAPYPGYVGISRTVPADQITCVESGHAEASPQCPAILTFASRQIVSDYNTVFSTADDAAANCNTADGFVTVRYGWFKVEGFICSPLNNGQGQ